MFGSGRNSSDFIQWFTDGERRYGTALWKLASVRLTAQETHPDYGRRKVWREGKESGDENQRVSRAKASGVGQRLRIHSRRSVLPMKFMPITMKRRIVRYDGDKSAYRRRKNLYAKRLEGLQRVLDVQRLVHN